MRGLSAVLFPGLLIWAACSGDEGPAGPSPIEKPEVRGVIGPSGGTLHSEDMALTIPPGAFAAEVDLSLYRESLENPFGQEHVGPGYRIEGLPEAFSQPLGLSLLLHTADADSLVGLLGDDVWVPSLDELHLVYEPVDATRDEGWARFEIPARPVLEKRATAVANGGSLHVAVGRGVAQWISENGLFRILYWARVTPQAQVEALGPYLEEAYARYYAWGFRHADFAGWPVKASVFRLKDSDYGWWAPSRYELGGRLAFNSTRMEDLPELRRTAHHELFHFYQYFYDPRSPTERTVSGAPSAWLDEACAVWAEAFITEDPAFVPVAWIGRELNPLRGVAPRPEDSAARHGYGVASLVHYIMRDHGLDLLVDTYEGIRQGQTAIMALRTRVKVPMDTWFSDYLTQLLMGTAFRPIPVTKVVAASDGFVLSISSDADTLGTAMQSVPELGGTLLQIQLNHPGPDQRATLELVATGGDCRLSVYGLESTDHLDLVASSASSPLVLDDLRGLNASYAELLVLVANRQATPPECFETSHVDLTARVVAPALPGYDFAFVSLSYDSEWSDGGSSTNDTLYLGTYGGSFDGAAFTASWDSLRTGGHRDQGHLNVSVDPRTGALLEWNAHKRFEDAGGSVYEIGAAGSQIAPPDFHPGYVEYSAEGPAACGAITTIYVVQYDAEGAVYRELESWACNDLSFATVRMADLEP